MLAQDLPNDRLDLSRQPLATATTAGAPRDQIRDHALPLAPPTQQDIHLPARNAQPLGCRLHHLLTGCPSLGQRADHLRPAHRNRPHLIGNAQQTTLRNPALIDRFVVHTTMEQQADRAHGYGHAGRSNSSAHYLKRAGRPRRRLRTFTRRDLGLGEGTPFIDVKLMASLLSMDAYRIAFGGGGTTQIREVQQWLNATYSSRRDFALGPTDGRFSRQVLTAMLYALQYEIGMADGVANGNFGPGTRAGLRTKATVGPGSRDGSTRFVRLFQGALRFNQYNAPFTSSFDSATEVITREFQSFMEIPISGRGDYTTWCNLLVSSGDTTISTRGFDTNRQLSRAQAAAARDAG